MSSPSSRKTKKKKNNRKEVKKLISNEDGTSSKASNLTTEQKEFYLNQINSLEVRLIKYVYSAMYTDFYVHMFNHVH